jgi:hypothetical protein
MAESSSNTTHGAERDERILEWVRREAGVPEPRRVVRVDERGVLLSKFEPGFASRLHELLVLLPELFDETSVVARYQVQASTSSPGTSRVEAWHAAMHEALREAGERHAIPDPRLAEVRTGIDSVRAVLEGVLWSGPLVEDRDYAPLRGEVEAYLDGLEALEDGRDLFSRYYGSFEGLPVRNHCPGASHARLMLAHAWRACTGTEAPGRS